MTELEKAAKEYARLIFQNDRQPINQEAAELDFIAGANYQKDLWPSDDQIKLDAKTYRMFALSNFNGSPSEYDEKAESIERTYFEAIHKLKQKYNLIPKQK